VKFVLNGNTMDATMYRLADTSGPVWEPKDTFKVEANRTRSSKSTKSDKTAANR